MCVRVPMCIDRLSLSVQVIAPVKFNNDERSAT